MNGLQILPTLARPVKDASLRYNEQGKPNASMRVAVEYRYPERDKDGKQVMKDGVKQFKGQTTFIDAVAFGPLAERLGNRAKKGVEMIIEGRIKTRTYEVKDKDGNVLKKEDGVTPVKRSVQELILSHFRVIPRPQAETTADPEADLSQDEPSDEGGDEPTE